MAVAGSSVESLGLAAGLAVLGNDQVAVAAIDHVLDVVDLMPRPHHEPGRVCADAPVLGQRQRDALGAVAVGTLAQELDVTAVGAATLGNDPLEPLVGIPEAVFVTGQPPFALFHNRDGRR